MIRHHSNGAHLAWHSCQCPEKSKPVELRRWEILQYRCNCSAFNGGQKTPSDYSEIKCIGCGNIWRTKAAYVDKIAALQTGEGVTLAIDAVWLRRKNAEDDSEQECEAGILHPEALQTGEGESECERCCSTLHATKDCPEET